jgi:hypothetical protein
MKQWQRIFLILPIIFLAGCGSDDIYTDPANPPVYAPIEQSLGLFFSDPGISNGSNVNSGDTIVFQIQGGQFPLTIKNQSLINTTYTDLSLDIADPFITLQIGNNTTGSDYQENLVIQDSTGKSENLSFNVSSTFQIKNPVGEVDSDSPVKIGELWGGLLPYTASIVSSNSTNSSIFITMDTTTGRGDLFFTPGSFGQETIQIQDGSNNTWQWEVIIGQ